MAFESDPGLVAAVRRFGTFDTNACYQCGSCTITCDLTVDSASFPRRPIRYALLGLRDPLLGSLDPWLCHDCGDCTTTCPRQADPAAAMATLRRFLAGQYEWTGLSAAIHRSMVWAIGAHVIVAVFVLALVVLYHAVAVPIPLGQLASLPLGVEHMFGLITTFTRVIFVLAFVLLVANAARMVWLATHRGNAVHAPLAVYLTEAKIFFLQALSQSRFRACPNKRRWFKHLVLVVGCVLVSLLLLVFLEWFQTDAIYPLYHPQRWLGYLTAAAIIFGAVDILVGRIKRREPVHKFSDPTDWTFPISLLLVALTGLAVHVLRYAGLALSAHYAYAAHVAVAVPLIVIEIPFGKGGHMLYRPLAIYLQRVKDAAQRQLEAERSVEHAA